MEDRVESRTLFYLKDLPRALHGTVVFSPAAARQESAPVTSVTLDSRTCSPGSLFVALPGENTDGHRYVEEAFRAGAVAALVQEPCAPDGSEWENPVIQVADTLTALQQIAAWYVRTFLGGIVRIGITGSNGKTTTKEFVAAILREAHQTSASAGNLNSETGVPLAVFDTDPAAAYAVYEMAMSNTGEMEPLAEIIRPDYAIITNIGTAHIGMLGSRDAIAREKKAIASRFEGTQTLFLPEDDPFTPFLADAVRGTVKLFGPRVQNVEFDFESDPRQVRVSGAETVLVPRGGRHNGLNALAAIALARELGISTDCIARGIAGASLPQGRSEVIHGAGERIIVNDSYNANPDSATAALEMTVAIHRNRTGRGALVLILGAMKELGADTTEAHRQVLDLARNTSPARILLVGREEWLPVFDGDDPVISLFSDTGALARALPDLLVSGDETILLKGSRSVALEQVIPFLQEGRHA